MQNRKELPLYKEFNEQVADIVYNKYLWKDKAGNPIDRSFKDIVKRMVKAASKYPKFMDKQDLVDLENALLDRDLIPGGSILAGLGTNKNTSLSNCFVIPPAEDNYESIIGNDAKQTHIMKRRGGVGHDLSNIRPKGSPVNNSAQTSTGIVPFMKRYSRATEEVAQDGRRGALMLTIDEKHADAIDFVNAKRDTTSITGANISLRATDWLFTQDKLFDAVVDSMWNYAEPGLLYWDNILDNPIDAMGVDEFKTSSTNPCGEIPLNPYGSCILAHINLYNMVDSPFSLSAGVSEPKLSRTIELGVKFLNVVVEEELKHIQRIINLSENGHERSTWLNIKKILKKGRRIGLGRTGFGDMLAAVNMGYDNNVDTIDMTEWTSRVILSVAYRTSCNLPIVAPILEDDDNYANFIGHKLYENQNPNIGRPANIGLLTVAPVGSGSQLAGVTSGIEPLFLPSYNRKRRATENEEYNTVVNGKRWIETKIIHPPLLDFARTRGYNGFEDELDIDEIFKESPYYMSTTNEVDVKHKIELLSIMQKHIDQSISVTHNVPKDYPKENLYHLIEYAHDKGLKGFTLYRDGSREGILTAEPAAKELPKKRPDVLECNVHNVKVDGHAWTVIIGLLNNKPYELFALKVKNVTVKDLKKAKLIKYRIDGESYYKLDSNSITINDLASLYTSGNEEILTRMISKRWQEGVSIAGVLEVFNKVELNIGTFEQAIKRVISKYVEIKSTGETCPECGSPLIYEDGCKSCSSCSYSKCG